ncbi:hypothetical protein MIMGU_mgv1a007493mg [Erythranthe guttata]|uniref:Box C/D snoRNA protein 1 n=1 Tax=Erythranthe guttata TaxID=4155 RepID=A0A022RR35_ERYGU|nr:PREDICTED: box C/D snoRNA protein 1 [Erythranthe guttata]EYU42238.1 hypothetical protein MIMGU_mgv1a007493mg [Erythranthe guttata]|eukprot:XP_012831400.1 PREDICTED: box C/D snoRNA protein 1 [Erythranthe guttata]
MAEEEPEQQPSPPSEDKPQPNLCEECNTNASKYKCPGCSLRTCSLTCVNSHKLRTSCTGKRPLTDFVPISKFDDNLLISDYKMLEEVKRIADSAQRTRVKLCGNYQFRLPFHLKSLKNAALSRRTKLLFLSNGMSKRETNQTYYNNRKKFISWTIEWRFHLTEIVLVDHGVNENTTLSSLIENHLKPGPWNHSLRPFCDENLDSLKFFIRKYPKGVKSPYRQLNIEAPIREQLANLVILEYPVIHVYLPSHTYDFDVIKDIIPRKVEIKKSDNHDFPNHQGVTFKEEEIEDVGHPDTQVSDLLNYDANESEGAKQSEPASQDDNSNFAITEDSNGVPSDSCIEQLVAIGDFDFEPGSVDFCPDLIGDDSTDDYLDFDAILLAEQKYMEGGAYVMDEEPEEGELSS